MTGTLLLFTLLSHTALDAPRASDAAANLDFDLGVESAPKVTAESKKRALDLESALKTRRIMLTLHQGVGLTMLGAMAATAVVGNLNLVDKYGGGGDTNRYFTLHKDLVIASTSLFALGAALGLLAPVPYPKPPRWDGISWHKLFMATAAAMLVAQIVLGIIVQAIPGTLTQVNLVPVHQVLGYATVGAVTAGVLTFVFD